MEKKLSSNAGHHEASTCRIRGESADHARNETTKEGFHPGFETQGRCHQESKPVALMAPQKVLYVLQILKKKIFFAT